jgi:hypothetical protein
MFPQYLAHAVGDGVVHELRRAEEAFGRRYGVAWQTAGAQAAFMTSSTVTLVSAWLLRRQARR